MRNIFQKNFFSTKNEFENIYWNRLELFCVTISYVKFYVKYEKTNQLISAILCLLLQSISVRLIDNMYSIVTLQAQNRKLVVSTSWVERRKMRKPTKIFWSVNQDANPDFQLATRYFVQDENACYNGYCVRRCREY